MSGASACLDEGSNPRELLAADRTIGRWTRVVKLMRVGGDADLLGQNSIHLTCFDVKPHLCRGYSLASQTDGHLPQLAASFERLLQDGPQPQSEAIRICSRGFAAHFNIGLNVSRSYFRLECPINMYERTRPSGYAAEASSQSINVGRLAANMLNANIAVVEASPRAVLAPRQQAILYCSTRPSAVEC